MGPETVDTHRAVAVWSGSSEAGENPRWAPGKAPWWDSLAYCRTNS